MWLERKDTIQRLIETTNEDLEEVTVTKMF
jgi:hypothetical protein